MKPPQAGDVTIVRAREDGDSRDQEEGACQATGRMACPGAL